MPMSTSMAVHGLFSVLPNCMNDASFVLQVGPTTDQHLVGEHQRDVTAGQ